MFVACSTLCFGRQPLEEALRSIATLQFGKYDMALLEHGCQLKPSQVAADVQEAAARLRVGPGLVPSAFTLDLDAPDEAEQDRQFKAVCRLARLSAVPVITVKPSVTGVPLEAESARLSKLVRLAAADGVLLCAATLGGTHAGTPDEAVRLCEKTPGLCLTLDPSHWIAFDNYDQVYPFVRHVHLRDTGRGPNQFQVRVGQGGIEYGRITAQLERCRYNLALAVDIRDIPDAPFAMAPEVRKLKYLLESLV